MPAPVALFLDFNLPNATTWFYFSFLLSMALFFKFSRLVCVRNLDVAIIFLLMPGMLIVHAARLPIAAERLPATQIAALVGQGAGADTPAALVWQVARLTHQSGPTLELMSWQRAGYLWLLVGSVLFFCRCLFDLTLLQRPALAPNLQTGGLAWLAGALLICLLAVAYRQVEQHLQLTASNGAAPSGTNPSAALEPSVFAVEVFWRGWPAWAVAALAFACHVIIVFSLILIAWRHFQDLAAGMAAATFYVLLPYTGMFVGQIHHALPMALFLATILAYRIPSLSGFLLGIATAATYFPIFVLPIWVSFYRHHGLGRFCLTFCLALILGLSLVGSTLWLHGELESSLRNAFESSTWQPWRVPNTEGFWIGVSWAYRIPVLLLYLSFIIATMFWPAPKNLAHVIALSAAAFIGLQWWCADQGGIYVLWYVPLILLQVFRPNLHDRVPPPIDSETDWLSKTLRWCARHLGFIVKTPQPPNMTGVR